MFCFFNLSDHNAIGTHIVFDNSVADTYLTDIFKAWVSFVPTYSCLWPASEQLLTWQTLMWQTIHYKNPFLPTDSCLQTALYQLPTRFPQKLKFPRVLKKPNTSSVQNTECGQKFARITSSACREFAIQGIKHSNRNRIKVQTVNH